MNWRRFDIARSAAVELALWACASIGSQSEGAVNPERRQNEKRLWADVRLRLAQLRAQIGVEQCVAMPFMPLAIEVSSRGEPSTVTHVWKVEAIDRRDWLEDLMPIYEYECDRCSLRFELKRRFSENSEVSCPRCQGEVRQVFSPVPIIFKGPGFYVTDNMTEGRSRYGSGWDGDYTADVGKMTELAGENK